MYTLSCHVYYDHIDQNAPYWVSIRLTCLTAVTFQVSKSHGSPKTNFTACTQRECPKEHLVKN